MLRNTSRARPRTDTIPVLPLARDGRCMRGISAIGFLVAGSLALGTLAIADPSAAVRDIDSKALCAANAYELAVQLPAKIRKGEPASLILHVQKNSRPADDVAPCMAPAPLFASEEDVTDTTPAIGSDLGAGAEPTTQPACVMAIAAVRTAPGVYQFTWEPDTAGRVNLQFTAGDSQLDVAVNVRSAPPNPTILIAFVFLVGVILSVAARMRHMQRQRGGAA
jgi:hypothetical protein